MHHSLKIRLFLFLVLNIKSRNLHILKTAFDLGELRAIESYRTYVYMYVYIYTEIIKCTYDFRLLGEIQMNQLVNGISYISHNCFSSLNFLNSIWHF